MTSPGFISPVLLLATLAPQMVEEAEIGILVVGAGEYAGRILYANKAAEDMLGTPRDLLTGQQVERFVPERVREGHVSQRQEFTEGMAGPRVRWMGQARDIFLVNAEGREIPVRIGLTRVMTLEGRYVFVYISHREDDQEADARDVLASQSED